MILLAEHNEIVRKEFTKYFQDSGEKFVVCTDSDSLWGAVQENAFSVIFLNWELPGVGARDACRRIRSLPQGEQSVLVALVDLDSELVAPDVLKDGADDYLSTSSDDSMIADRLAVFKSLASRRAAQALGETGDNTAWRRGLVDAAGSVVICIGPDGTIIEFNREAQRITGWGRQEMVGKNYLDLLLNERSRDSAREMIQQVMEWATVRPFEQGMLTRHGGERSVLWNLSLLTDTRRLPSGVLAIGQDITERKRVEQELKYSESLYRAVLTQSADSIYLLETDTKAVSRANEAFQVLLGYSPEELESLTLYDLVDHSAEDVDTLVKQVIESGSLFLEARKYLKKGGGVVDVEVSATLISLGSNEIICVVARDITERLAAEEEMRRLKAFYEEAIDNLPIQVSVLDLEFRYIYLNRAALTDPSMRRWIVGRTDEEYCTRTGRDMEIAATRRSLMERALEERATVDFEEVLIGSVGEARTIIRSYTPVFDENGKVDMIIGQGIDYTERRKTEGELKSEQDRFRSVADCLGEGLIIADFSDSVEYVNSRMTDLLGYDRPEDMEGSEAHKHLVEADDWNRMRAGAKSGDEFDPQTIEVEMLRSDGTQFWAEVNATPFRDSSGEIVGTLGAVTDITDRREAEVQRKELEDQLRMAAKLEGLGVLAGGIAHDFNNLLTSILGNAGMALRRLSPQSPARGSVQQIQTAATRAADLTKQLLAYSGKGQFIIEPMSLSKLVVEMAQLLEVAISKKVELTYECPLDIPMVEADRAQLQQVVMNLIKNASDSIGDEAGTVKASTGLIQADKKCLSEVYMNADLEEGPYVYVQVTDTGCGMTEETRAKIFDPFFTTKFTGRGLGLAAVLGIVRGHKGAIRLESEVGVGTTFQVLFPATEKEAEVRPETGGGTSDFEGTGTILVVDDEEAVQSLAQAILEEFGYTVILAADGLEGVEMFKKHIDEIDLVLMDMMMPNMNGDEAFREMRALSPEIKVIISSGYSEQDTVGKFEGGDGISGFVQKPYQIQTMVERVQIVLRS